MPSSNDPKGGFFARLLVRGKVERTAHVLIVDDEPHIRRLIQVNLERAGFATSTAENGQAALERLEEEPRVDLVIVDVMMPVMDGLTFLRAIRDRPETADLPAIVLGGLRNDIPDALERMQAFFDERFGRCSYMVKPFNPGEMVHRVGWMLANRPSGKT